MKILFLYFMLAFLGLAMIITIDLLSGMSFSMALRSIRIAFATTSTQEDVTMLFFLFLPFINVIAAAIKKQKQ